MGRHLLQVNKIGDSDAKVGSRAVHLLQTLVYHHSAMKEVVVAAVEELAFRPNVGARAQYYTVIFLSNLSLARGTDAKLAVQLIGTYFSLFEQCVRGGEPQHSGKGSRATAGGGGGGDGVQSKLLGALLSGVNRAYPYASEALDEVTTSRHVEALFRLVHAGHVNVGVQALQLLLQVTATGSSLSHRLYRALYGTLLSPQLVDCRKQAMLLNIVFKAMKADTDAGRVKAMAKRLLQICAYHHPPFVCGVLFMLSEVAKLRHDLRKWIRSLKPKKKKDGPDAAISDETLEKEAQVSKKKAEAATAAVAVARSNAALVEEEDDGIEVKMTTTRPGAGDQISGTQHKYLNVPDAQGSDGADELDDDDDVDSNDAENEGGTAAYDPRKRDPMHSNATASYLWELHQLARHFHPTVASFAASLLEAKPIEYNGDPLADHTITAFLDRFMSKKPKAAKRLAAGPSAYTTHAGRTRLASAGADGVAVNSPAFAALSEEKVPDADQFFHQFFKRRAVRDQLGKKKKKAAAAAAKPKDVTGATAEGRPSAESGTADSGTFDYDSMPLEDEDHLDNGLGDASDDDDFAFDDDLSDEDGSEDGGDSDGEAEEDDSGRSRLHNADAFADADDFAAMIAEGSTDGGSSKADAWQQQRIASTSFKGSKRGGKQKRGGQKNKKQKR